jgi:HEPN domain-containing protein
MKDITREWLELAFLDLESISRLIIDERLTSQVAFHAQQAIEKSLKAILEEFGEKVPRIHSLSKLFDLCSHFIGIEVDELMVIALDSMYTESRYPGDHGLLPEGKPSMKQAQQFFEFAQLVHKKILSNLLRK